MPDFREKGIFLWCYWDISEDPGVVADRLVEGGFEAVYIHANDGPFEGSYGQMQPNGTYKDRVNCTDELVAEFRSRGLRVYGWGAPYGRNLAGEISIMVSQTKRYGLEGYVIDAEGRWDAQGDVYSDTRAILTEYKRQCPGTPVAWCWWPHYRSLSGGTWHDKAILRLAMQYADFGMPMAYWNWGDSEAMVVAYVEECWRQWREVTSKPLILAGRAYADQYSSAPYAAVMAFDHAARRLGSVGITWWDLQHAINLGGTWRALQETFPFGEEVEMTDWTQNAILLYTKKAGWTNKAFHAIVGHAGGGWAEPNPDLKPIELQTAEEGKPFLVLWDFDVDFYVRNQYDGRDETWPPLSNDWPYQMIVRALTSRSPKAVIIRVMTQGSTVNAAEDPNYIAYAAKVFLGRVGDWLAQAKPDCKLVLCTSNPFIEKYSPAMNNWAYQYPVAIEQKAILPLVSNAYPQPTDKITAYISTRPTWEFWRYYSTEGQSFLLFNGKPDALYKWLSFTAEQPDTTPPSAPTSLTGTANGSTVTLAWQAATDATGVAGYQVYHGTEKLLTTSALEATIPNQLPGTHQFGVSAIDAAGNEGPQANVSVSVASSEPGDSDLVELLAIARETNALMKEIRAHFKP